MYNPTHTTKSNPLDKIISRDCPKRRKESRPHLVCMAQPCSKQHRPPKLSQGHDAVCLGKGHASNGSWRQTQVRWSREHWQQAGNVCVTFPFRARASRHAKSYTSHSPPFIVNDRDFHPPRAAVRMAIRAAITISVTSFLLGMCPHKNCCLQRFIPGPLKPRMRFVKQACFSPTGLQIHLPSGRHLSPMLIYGSQLDITMCLPKGPQELATPLPLLLRSAPSRFSGVSATARRET